jgi:phosphoglycolate phosphatase-like HAD superfamily hydrolase
MKNIFVFDLDDTVINSNHRLVNNLDGTLNLAAYREKATPENIAKDTLLPLAKVLQRLVVTGANVVICTAREMSTADYLYIGRHGLADYRTLILSRDRAQNYHKAMSDGQYKAHWLDLMQLSPKRVIMFDDAKPVKTVLRAKGFTVICPHKLNARLK